jgi:SNF2 family DNA or RNA helicase
MVDLFNAENSTLKVLIMLYDVGAVGLNLHKACNRVVIASLPRSRAQESQLGGRALRVSIYPASYKLRSNEVD